MKTHKPKENEKAFLQCCHPNVSIFYHIYNIVNAFWLLTAEPLTTEALGNTL